MQLLKELNEANSIAKLELILQFQEAEFADMMGQEVQINEQDENTLNAILNDVDRRFGEARQSLSDANRSRDPGQKKEMMSNAMKDLNRTRGLLDQVLKKWFPADGKEPARKPLEHMISPREAAEALGVHTSRIQNLVSSGKLRMHSDNGRWAVRGADVQALIDQQAQGA